MSKKFKSQASSSRAAAGGASAFGGFSSVFGGQGKEPSSLTYVTEPPDLTVISDQQLVISFKNFQKKDDTTRTKALDDLKEFVSGVEARQEPLNDGFLEAWVKVYPRASIDLSRRVRQTAHTIQGSVACLVGKRIARHLPRVIGAWLAGIYDNDRLVARSALESFTRAFSTEEKRNSVWKICQSSILEFVDDVILQQTPLTLSDERTVKPDDAEAKYARVVGAALSLFNRVLGSSASEVLQKDAGTIETLLGSKSLWSFCFHEDAFVRRSLYVLLRSAVTKEPADLNWKIISSALIGKSLTISQMGSATELSDCLLEVTISRPQLWTEDYSGKSSSSKRLLQYVKKGSQGASSTFWANLAQLLRALPQQILANIAAESASAEHAISDGAQCLLDAYLDGINSREEPRQNLVAAWKSFAEVTVWLSAQLPTNDQGSLITANLCPLFERYVTVSQDQSRWTVPVQASEIILVDTFAMLTHNGYQKQLRESWSGICAKLVEAVKLSAPEQSKDFRTSQDAICAQAKRLFSMEAAIIQRISDTEYEEVALNVFEKSNTSLIEDCLQVLRSRNGKPYGAAAVVGEAIDNVPEIARRSTELVKFMQHDAPMLLLSPSADRLVAMILACRQWEGLESTSETIVDQILQMEPEPSNTKVVRKFFSELNLDEVGDKTKLKSLVLDALDKACRGSELHWPVVVSVLHNPTSHGELADAIFLSIIESLSTDSTAVAAMQGLLQIASSELSALQRFQSGPHGSKLTGKLLFLAESPEEELAFHAETLLARLRGAVAGELRAKSNLEVLRHSFTVVNNESLSIESLVKIAEDLLDLAQPDDMGRTASEVLPSKADWEKAIRPFLDCPLPRSKAITSPLRGITQLVDLHPSGKVLKELENVPRDSEHHSSAFRLAFFTVQLLSGCRLIEFVDSENLEALFFNLPLAIQLIEDDLRIQNCNGITGLQLPDQRDELMEIVNNGRQLIRDWANSKKPLRDGADESMSSLLESFWQAWLDGLQGVSPLDYRIGEAFVDIMRALSPLAATSPEKITNLCRECRTSNAIRTGSWFAVLRSRILEAPAGIRLCNELIADGTDIQPQDERNNGLRKLALLNMLLSFDKNEDVISSIPTQRLVFLMKNLVRCLESDTVHSGLKAEIFESLTILLPRLAEIYGSHWESVMRNLNATWRAFDGHDEMLPMIAASFNLFARLVSITEGESNDDLVDAWTQHKSDTRIEAVSVLLNFDSTTVFHEPRDLTVELCRSISGEPREKLENVSEFFALLTASSSTVQKAGFEVLHQYIPKSQEQISFDVALSKTTVSLPDELISLLLEPPTMDIFSATLSERAAWMSVRAYLLSWKVVFDHFSNASLAVQEYYASNLKQNGIFTPLLEFTFDFLQKSHGKLVDASNMNIRHFELDRADSREKETQWLLVHLYFLSLKYLPNMTKNWWLDTKKRIKGPVEAWTEKHISPLVIEDALQSVSDWEQTQDRSEERGLVLKISPKAAEIIASILVDEESPPVAISIDLPPAYPLQPALVMGRSRVLVDERKWKSWLLTIQGVIMFANGNLVDGLLAFRRNVQGALKGQSECAICYSVISTDMQTPNKRCATCKNTFHSVCLFRWFKSSNQSTCPLCRNNFVYV